MAGARRPRLWLGKLRTKDGGRKKELQDISVIRMVTASRASFDYGSTPFQGVLKS